MSTTIRPTQSAAPFRSNLRSIGVVAAAFVVMAIATGVVDQILHWLGVFPPWGQVTYEPVPYVLAIVYRTAFGVGGAYFAARWAPRASARHALWLGIIGLVLSFGGVIAAVTHDLGPVWYPVTLLVLALPSAWTGGALYARSAR